MVRVTIKDGEKSLEGKFMETIETPKEGKITYYKTPQAEGLITNEAAPIIIGPPKQLPRKRSPRKKPVKDIPKKVLILAVNNYLNGYARAYKTALIKFEGRKDRSTVIENYEEMEKVRKWLGGKD